MADTEDNEEMSRKLAHLLRQREVLREQSELIADAIARVADEIELLRAQARAAGLDLGAEAAE